MDINDIQFRGQQIPEKSSQVQQKKEEMALEFERMFAKQLVEEMTKDLFKQDDNKAMMTSGNQMYRSHIVDTLSEALANEEKLGMSDMLKEHWNVKIENANDTSESKPER